MATKISTIYTLITADDKPLKRGLDSARTASISGAKKIQNALNKINFKAIALGATAMAATLGFAASKFIKLAIEQERVEKRLGAVLRSTGEAAGYNLDELKKMASAMQAVTTTGDETILSGMAILATFKQIRGQAFERTTMSALDLAEVVGTDLNAAMIQLGKALNDPVANLGALSRAGIQFTKDQKVLIKGLWESGKTAEAQGLILDELESQFGGAAKAARDTFGGALQSLKNTLGDIGENIGFALMPPIKELIDRFASWIRINDNLINQDIPAFITRVGSAAATTAKFLYQMNKALDVALGVKTEDSILEAHLKQLKEVEKKYIDQKKRLEAVGWTGGEAYKKIERQLSLVREKIKLVNAEVAEFLREKFFGKKEAGPMDAHVKAYYAALGAAELATAAAKKHEEAIQKINTAYIETLPNLQVFRDSWEWMLEGGVKPFGEGQLEALEQIKNATESLASKGINDELTAAFEGVEVVAKKSYSSMIELSERTAWAMQENFSNVFFDAMTGELKTFGDYAKSILTSIQRAIADITSQLVTEGLFGPGMKGGGWISSLFGGSTSAASPAASTPYVGYEYANGGYIGEPVRGIGMSSGRSYEFDPNEIVTPAGKAGGVQVAVNVVNNLGQEADVSQSSSWISPDQMVTDIILNKKMTSRGFRQGMRA